MARPRILGETKREVEEREPPCPDSIRPAEWLSGESMEAYEDVLESARPFEMYLSDLAERKIRDHAIKEAGRRLEVMGFLLGEVSKWKGETYTVVRDVGTTHLKSSSSKVRFDPEAFPKLFYELDDLGFDYVLVGWYHSHPGHTCFLSRTDLDTQRSVFDQPYHSALVIDPINKDVKTFRLAGEGYEEMTFAVFDSGSFPIRKPRTNRQRKLKVKPVVRT